MIPISLLYGQPEDAVAQMRYLAARHYPVSYVEMGEEVDGQYMSPEDYAALYLQFAKALHAYDPTLKLGGPAFEGVNEDITTWPDEQGRISWLGRFLDYLKQHGKIDELAFFSFEHYPFEPCKFSWAALYDEPNLISHIMQVWRDDGLPPNVPVFITESNLSSIATEAYFDNFGGLWLADYIGSFLNAGGDAAYFFHYLPLQSGHGCNGSFGNYGMFRVDANYKIIQPLAQFYSSQIINTEWLQPGAQSNTIFPSSSLVDDGAGHKMVTSYAAQRPDKQWSILLVNRDQNVAHTFKVAFHQSVTGKSFGFRGQVDRIAFGKDQYQWRASGTLSMPHPNASANEKEGYEGHADPGGSILRTNITATPETTFTIPAASILVLRGAVAAAD